jgi:hypothetical protein
MIVTNKLYRKDFNQYSKDDWKYIFSIYTLRDKYNFTEEELLAAELVDKVTILKKMDENLFIEGKIDIDSLHKNESVFEPCPRDGGCKVIQDFLEDEDIKDHIHSPEDALKDFLDDKKIHDVKPKRLSSRDGKQFFTVRLYNVEDYQEFIEPDGKEKYEASEERKRARTEDLNYVFKSRLAADSEEQLRYNALIESIVEYKDYDEYKYKTSFKYKVLKFLKLTK